MGRDDRANVGIHMVKLRQELGDEEFGILFPNAKKQADELMSLLK
jgi:hypothetical protein